MSNPKSMLLLLSIVSGIILAPLAYTITASGLCILHPELAIFLTLGAVQGDSMFCYRLHTSPALQLATITVGAVHAYTTAELVALRLSNVSSIARIIHAIYRLAVLLLATLLASITVLHFILG